MRSAHSIFILPILLIALLATALVACGDDDGDDPGTTPPPSASPSPSPEEPEGSPTPEEPEGSPTPAPGDPSPSPEPEDPTPKPGTTGNPDFDRLIELFEGRDIASLADAIRYTQLACEADIQGLGGPPECLEGEADGTIVSVMPFAGCEGSYTRPEMVNAMFEAQIIEPEFYAAFSFAEKGTDVFPKGDYGLLFTVEGPSGMDPLGFMLGVSEDGNIISIWRGCGATAAGIFDQHAGDEILVEPAA